MIALLSWRRAASFSKWTHDESSLCFCTNTRQQQSAPVSSGVSQEACIYYFNIKQINYAWWVFTFCALERREHDWRRLYCLSLQMSHLNFNPVCASHRAQSYGFYFSVVAAAHSYDFSCLKEWTSLHLMHIFVWAKFNWLRRSSWTGSTSDDKQPFTQRLLSERFIEIRSVVYVIFC